MPASQSHHYYCKDSQVARVSDPYIVAVLKRRGWTACTKREWLAAVRRIQKGK